jgi:hypothetical protein
MYDLFDKFNLGVKKTPNLMLILNPLKKFQKSLPEFDILVNKTHFIFQLCMVPRSNVSQKIQ